MSERQITSYLSRIALDDENRDLFIRVIIPLLRRCAQETSEKASAGTICPFCDTGSSANFLGKSKEPSPKTTVRYTSYYTLVRHLSTKHRELLPCNGYVLSDSEPTKYACQPCDQQFSRKDHYNTHLRSNKHLRNSNGSKQIEKQKEERYKQLCSVRNCTVVIEKHPSIDSNGVAEYKQNSTKDDKYLTPEQALELIEDFDDFVSDPEDQANLKLSETDEPDLPLHLTFASGDDELDFSELYENFKIHGGQLPTSIEANESSKFHGFTLSTQSDMPVRTDCEDQATSSETIEVNNDIAEQDPQEEKHEISDNTQSDCDDDDSDLVQALCSFELERNRLMSTHKRVHHELWDSGSSEDETLGQ